MPTSFAGRSRIARSCAIWVCLVTASAHAAPADSPAAPNQAGGGDIVVNGAIEPQSAWKRVESDHVVLTSKGSDADLKRLSNNLELLYRLLSRLYRPAATPDDTIKLQVTLTDPGTSLRAMGLRNLRSEEGPYPASFDLQRYYDPREDGVVLAVARNDQTVEMNTTLQRDKDFTDSMGDPAYQPYHPPAMRRWEALLYSAFAQHFMLTYLPAAYPRWYIDGIGALFSTSVVHQDGAIDYACAPENYWTIFLAYGQLDVGAILTGHYLDAPGKAAWTPYHAWLLAHFFLFSNLKPERSRQFAHYMAAIRQGMPMAEAAKAFGDMRRLQNELAIYTEKPKYFAHTQPSRAPVGEPLIQTVSRASAAMIEARIELGTRLAPDESAAQPSTAWLDDVRGKAAQARANPEAILVAAEAECRSAHFDACLADADRLLAQSPDNVAALAWKGTALTHQALAGPVAVRAETLAAARATIEHAGKIDGDAPLPLIAYFRSFADAGERVPESAMLGMAKVVRLLPAAPGPRLYLGAELVRQGQADLARQVLNPVLYGAYDSPEKAAALALFAPNGAAGGR